jgi:hypothetical protein
MQDQILLDIAENDRNDLWRLAVTLVYRITPKQPDGCSLASSWQVFQQWLPNLQVLLECTTNPTFSLINHSTLKNACVLVEVVRIHSWFLFEHGRYNEALTMLSTAKDICDCMSDNLTAEEDYPVSPVTVKVCLSVVRDIQGSIAFERNQGVDSLKAKKEMLLLQKEAIPQTEFQITIAEADVGLGEIFFGDREKGRELLEKCVKKTPGIHKRRWQANLALYWLLQKNLNEASKMIGEALRNEDDPLEMASFDSQFPTLLNPPLAFDTYSLSVPDHISLAARFSTARVNSAMLKRNFENAGSSERSIYPPTTT